MREALLEAYWDVFRDGLGFKEAADRRGVNRGELYRICKTSIIPRPVGRPAAFDEFASNLQLWRSDVGIWNGWD